jgi:hypothetical protein
MKRLLTTALIAITLTGSTRGLPEAQNKQPGLSFVSQATNTRQLGPCDEEQWLRISPAEWTPDPVRGLIRCAVARWPVNGGAPKAIAVFSCESSLFPWASSNGNLGIGQLRFWHDRANRYLRARWFNDAQWHRIRSVPHGAFVARANVIVSVRLAHSGWGPWEAGKCA